MCGRARCSMSRATIENVTNCSNWIDQEKYLPCENICPGGTLPVMISFNGNNNCLRNMSWGLIPSSSDPSSKPNFFKMFNARSESLCEKKSFKNLLKTRRCIVIIDGFYEWRTECGSKQPYYIFLNDRKPLMVAGLYDIWESSDSTTIHSCTMLTCSSSKSISMLHDRQPAVLNEEAIFKWLHTDILNQMNINDFIRNYANNDFIFHPVHPRMSKPSYQNTDCSKAVQLFPSINRFLQLVSPEFKTISENESNVISGNETLTDESQHIRTLNFENVPMTTSTTTTTSSTSNQDELIYPNVTNIPNICNIIVDMPMNPSADSGSKNSSTNYNFDNSSDSGHPEYKKEVSSPTTSSNSSSSSNNSKKRQRTLSKGNQDHKTPSVLNYFKRNNNLAKELF